MLTFVVAFFCGFCLDVVWTRCVACVQHQRALAASNLSVVLYGCTIVSTVLIVEKNLTAVCLYAAGGWVGTYLATRGKL